MIFLCDKDRIPHSYINTNMYFCKFCCAFNDCTRESDIHVGPLRQVVHVKKSAFAPLVV